jgi:hypothetical protein
MCILSGTDFGLTHYYPERTSDPVRPSPFDTPYQVSAHSSKTSNLTEPWCRAGI